MIIVRTPKGVYILDGVEEKVALALLEHKNPLTVTDIAKMVYGENCTLAQRNYILKLVREMSKKGILRTEKRSNIHYVYKNFKPIYLSIWLPVMSTISSLILLSIAIIYIFYLNIIYYTIPLLIIAVLNLCVIFYELYRFNYKLISIVKKLFKIRGR